MAALEHLLKMHVNMVTTWYPHGPPGEPKGAQKRPKKPSGPARGLGPGSLVPGPGPIGPGAWAHRPGPPGPGAWAHRARPGAWAQGPWARGLGPASRPWGLGPRTHVFAHSQLATYPCHSNVPMSSHVAN